MRLGVCNVGVLLNYQDTNHDFCYMLWVVSGLWDALTGLLRVTHPYSGSFHTPTDERNVEQVSMETGRRVFHQRVCQCAASTFWDTD